ncbi:MAG: hypothetical protein WA405_05320, partial [Candidatus Acidiferrales bacterium]
HCKIVNGGSVMQCGFSELEAAMNTMTIEGWNYTGIGVPAPDTTGIGRANNIESAEQEYQSGWADRKTDPKQKKQSSSKPVRAIRTGKHVYKHPYRLPGCVIGECYFEGTKYRYKVVDAEGNIVRGPIVVTEELTPISNSGLPPSLASSSSFSTTDGQYPDYVGLGSDTSTFPEGGTAITDQTLTVNQNGQNFPLSTKIQLTIRSDSSGDVTGVAHTLVP